MLERNIEKLLFACRWLLAPMYLGLSLALLALGVKFFQEVLHSLAVILTLAETDLVLSVLSLIDIVLVGSLMNADATPNDKILWYVVLHLTFVVSAVLLGVLDRIAFAAHRDS
jgi:uncharacterized membrane protein YqhA